MVLRKVSIGIAICLAVGGVGEALGLDLEELTQDDKSQSYAVVRVTDHYGLVKYEVLLKEKVKERREQLMSAYDVVMKKHELDKHGLSEEDREAFVSTPVKPKMLLVACNLSREKAGQKADKLQREYAKKQEGAGLFTGK